MKRFFALAILLFLSAMAHGQDTLVVQTLTLDSTVRSGVWEFPSDTNTWRKVLMRYRMRCHDALVGNGSVGCREWDYSCNTVVTDSARTDSARLSHATHIITNFSGSTFLIAAQPTFQYTQYTQQQVTFTNSPTDTTFVLAPAGTAASLLFPGTRLAKTQILYTAARLATATATAGELDGIILDLASIGGDIDHLRIRIKHVTTNALDPLNPVSMTMAEEVYFVNTPLGTGLQQFRFHTPFTWNGTDNIVVEFSYHDAAQASTTQGTQVSALGNVIQTTAADGFFRFGGAESINLNPNSVSGITNEITVAFWSYGASNLPQNTTVFEGTNASGARHINVHLPWSDGRVYWDCGADAGGYDRIDLAVNAADYRGKWTHWAFTKNVSTGEMKVFMNGTQVHSGTGKTKPIDLEQFRIGQALTGSGMVYYGDVNEFQVWSKALDAATIQAWMNRDITGSHPDYAFLEAYFKLDETSGSSVADASPASLSAQVSGIPNWQEHRGHTLHRNFADVLLEPTLSFMRGPYTLNLDTVLVLDSTLAPMHQVIGYGTSGTDLVATDTNYYYQAGNILVYDEAGQVVDTLIAATDSTITIGSLTYYLKMPARYELISFVTPYGNGLDLGIDGVMWEFDVTDFVPVLTGNKRMSVEGVGNYQEELDIQFLFIRGTPPRDVLDIQPIWPIRSEWDLWSGFQLSEILNDVIFEPRQVPLDSASASWKVRVAMTGHGQNGEFVVRWHFVKVNGVMIPQFRWQGFKECATIPVYPQGGTWLFDRAGWCPGDPTDIKEFELGGLATPGQPVTIDYGMDYVANTSSSDYRTMTQLVSYGPNNFNVDAAVTGVKRPNKEIAYARFNPACNEPVVFLRNEGTQALTSVDIQYNQKGGPTRTITWTGSIAFMETVEVALPVDNPVFWTGTANVFEVQLSNVNGGLDEQPDNDVYFSEYTPFDVFTQGEVKFFWRTNNYPAHNTWRLYDEQGNTVFQNTPFLTANTTYSEAFDLPPGCYTLRLNDTGDDGLYYWYTPSSGSGFARIMHNGSLFKSFDAEFGRFIQYDFYTEGSVGVEDGKAERFAVYPNPSSGVFNFLLEGTEYPEAEAVVYDVAGRTVWQGSFDSDSELRFHGMIDLSDQPSGTYWLRIGNDEKAYSKELSKF